MGKIVLITGGAGFIGTNTASFYLKKGCKVIVFDNLSRAGTTENLKWLKKQRGNFIFVKGDVRDDKKILAVFKKNKPNLILHLAAQTTMVNSVKRPREDFEINALGTFNVLEAMRKTRSEGAAFYSSTNKVIGNLSYIPTIEKERRYDYKYIKAIDENFPLNFHGPYGCSKGAGDQYFRDYSRIFGLNTVIFRQSTIYGPHQFGIAGQGWIAWFINRLLFDKPVTIYGNGKQVRDPLYIDDLISAINSALKNIKSARGKVYNIGGGRNFSLSILELFKILEDISDKKIKYKFGPWRPGDQKVYISDVRKAKADFNWKPKISPQEGVTKLYNWISENKTLIKKAGVFSK